MKLRNRFALALAWRLAAEAILLWLGRVATGDRQEPDNRLMASLGLLGIAGTLLYRSLVGLWIVTGRGPGGRLFAAEGGGPRQRPRG